MTGDLAAAVPPTLLAAAGFLFGAIIGSFLATILARWPRGKSVLAGRSHCDACGAALGPVDLVPIVSYAWLRGRCRRCGAPIGASHTLIEVATGLVGLVAVLVHPLPMAGATFLLGAILLILAALDAEHQWLPDALTLPLIPLGLAAAWLGFGPPVLDSVLGVLVGGGGLWLLAHCYRVVRGREGLGGGDPKLLAGIGAWVGVLALPLVLVGAGLMGLVAILLMRARGVPVGAATRLPLGTLMALAAWPIWLLADAIHSPTVQPLLTMAMD